MKANVLVGIVLIIVGVAAMVYGGISYTAREDVVQIGPIAVTAKEKKTIPLSPVVGGVAIAGGIVLVLRGSRRA